MADFFIRSDEQRLLHETAARVFAEPASLERNLADSGLLALPFAEADGGLHPDGSTDRSDLAIAFFAKGAAYGIDNLLVQAVLGGGLIAASSASDREAILSGIIEGRERVAVALHEPGARADWPDCQTRAIRTADGWQIDGTKTLVLGADTASRILILARVDDTPSGLALFLLDPAADGLTTRTYHLRDGSATSDWALNGVKVTANSCIIGPHSAVDAVQKAVALTRLCLAAEASGIVQSALAGTATYVGERKQFGQAIGAFQVIQHRLADMATLADQCGALAATIVQDSGDIAAIDRACRTISDMGMTATKAAIQLHGGYGMTEDLPYGQALRRMMTIALLF
jgi:alkylation response protein AidB-like acyl-CoA dehydrogenase